ncbi:hypothetical protein CC80DRAFT_501814 [Byssothecium circinans]|uniref:Uncharacterized protein n=1 Tax=Byssothecium circinans TaxID=147558 RepID=A0A6A5U6W9_9PLEO|nr:hypothetical protein CC80DRAFT_501814 [Byssothecium circinans]
MSPDGQDRQSAAGTDLWEKALEKGTKLLLMMQSTDFEAGAASPFDDSTNPDDYGYMTQDISDEYDPERVSTMNEIALTELGIGTQAHLFGGDNYHIMWATDHTTGPESWFSQILNPRAGLIIADLNTSPNHGENPAGKKLPDLRFWSDIAYLQWRSACAEYECKQSTSCDTPQPQASELNKVLEQIGAELSEWPGVLLKPDCEEAKVLLGSPNGSGVAFLLIDHKAQLGRKTVGGIRIFNDDESYLNLLFEIEDVVDDTTSEIEERVADATFKVKDIVDDTIFESEN